MAEDTPAGRSGGKARPSPSPGPRDRRVLDPRSVRGVAAGLVLFLSLSVIGVRPAAAQAGSFAEPAGEPAQVIEERGESPLYYRLPRDTVLPLLRFQLGAAWRLAVLEENARTALSLDILTGAEIGFGRGSTTALVAELGYSLVGRSEHWLAVGLGPTLRRFGPQVIGYRDTGRPHGDMAVALVPHLLVGAVGGTGAVGIRTAILFRFWIYAVELSHQYVSVDGRGIHEVRLMFGSYGLFGDWS